MASLSKDKTIKRLRAQLASHERLAAKGIYLTEEEYRESLLLKKKESASAMLHFINHCLSEDTDSRGRVTLASVNTKARFFMDNILNRDESVCPDELSEKIRKEADLIRAVANIFPVLCEESEQGKRFLLNLANTWSEEYKKELGV